MGGALSSRCSGGVVRAGDIIGGAFISACDGDSAVEILGSTTRLLDRLMRHRVAWGAGVDRGMSQGIEGIRLFLAVIWQWRL